MFNQTLFKKEWKSLTKILLAFLAILTMYIVIIIYMYTPEMNELMSDLLEAMPEVFAAVGMGVTGDGLLGFCVQYLYGFILFIFPAIFMVMVTNSLVCRYVDEGSMAYLLATPNTRRKIVITQWFVLNIVLLSLVIYILFCGILTSELLFPNELDIVGFMQVNAGLMALYFFLGNGLFCLSCFLNESDKFIKIAGGLLFVSYICNSIATMSTQFDFFKYFSFLTLFNPMKIVGDFSGQWLSLAVLIVGGIIFSVIGITGFEKRDLPL